jgi:hypothetical protein
MNKPRPGSKEAQDQGCTCPIMDNHYGNGVPDGSGGRNFWMNSDCPIHSSSPTPSNGGETV